jgi:hypothetical protein
MNPDAPCPRPTLAKLPRRDVSSNRKEPPLVFRILLLLSVLPVLAFAQRGGRLGPIGHGFGNVVFPATGIPRVTGHIPNLSSTIRGVNPAIPRGRGHGGGIVYPIAVPVFGGGYGYSAYPPVQPQPNITVVNAPPQTPTVIINHSYQPDRANPVVREYTETEPAVQSYQAPVPSNPDPPRRSLDDDKPTIYLIAMSNGSVYSAYAYWVESGTLHYITTGHAHNQASLSLVDTAVSEQLNRERGIEFRLRKAQ